MRRIILTVVCLVAVGSLFTAADATDRNEPILPIPVEKVGDLDKVELGKMLFFEPRLSKSGFISCNSCHNTATGGVDNLPSSIGHNWQLGPINSPTVFNSKYNFVQFWDGRAANLKEQAGGPIENPAEMASSHELAVKVLSSIPEYQDRFNTVYGPGEITIDKITDAIAVFEETLVTPNAPFDRWLLGDDEALTASELEGYGLFKTKGCTACHTGVGVGGTMYQKLGLVKPYDKDTETLGRFNVTGKDADKYFFKVPLLRNIELTAPYLHDGSIWDLKEVVALMAEYQLGIPVNDDEKTKIVAFLRTLTGDQPDISYPVLPPSRPDTPRPDRG